MRSPLIASVLVLVPLAAGCDDLCSGKDCMFTTTEWNLVKTMSPLPDPVPDPTNRYVQDEAAAALGQKLLYETRYSAALKVASTLGVVGDKAKVACVSCHLAPTFLDTRSVPNNLSVGVSWTLRNAPSLVNQVYYDWHNWIGSRRTLWEQAAFSPETGTNTAGDRCGYAHMLWDRYRDEYNAIFTDYPLSDRLDPATTDPKPIPTACKPKSSATAADGPWEMMSAEDKDLVIRIMANQGKAVAAFESKLISRNADFDRYVAGDETLEYPAAAKRGLRLFVGKAACANCHQGPFFSDQSFHNLGVSQTGPNVAATDNGRFEGVNDILKSAVKANGPYSDDPTVVWIDSLVMPEEGAKCASTDSVEEMPSTCGQFRTPTLRNVAQSAPYMHNGSLATLGDVVRFYNRGGESSGFVGRKDSRMRPLGLTDADVDDLVAFLETLTGEALPAELTAMPTLPP